MNIDEIISTEFIKWIIQFSMDIFSKITPKRTQKKKIHNLFKGRWYGYHMTKVLNDDGFDSNKPYRNAISRHTYEINKPNEIRGINSGSAADTISGVDKNINYSLKIREIPGGFLFDLNEEGQPDKLHIEVYPNLFSETGFLKQKEISGCIVGQTTDGKIFASTIILSRNQVDSNLWNSPEKMEKYIRSIKGIMVHDLYDESEYQRYADTASKIWISFKNGNHDLMLLMRLKMKSTGLLIYMLAIMTKIQKNN